MRRTAQRSWSQVARSQYGREVTPPLLALAVIVVAVAVVVIGLLFPGGPLRPQPVVGFSPGRLPGPVIALILIVAGLAAAIFGIGALVAALWMSN